MINVSIDFIGNGRLCSAEIELVGTVDSWIAKAKITGHPTTSYLPISYRLGDYLAPMFVTEEDRLFFEPLANALTEKAKMLLTAGLKSI